MQLTVNGESIEYNDDPALNVLVAARGANPQRVATVLNDTVIARDKRSSTTLQDGDRVEILAFAGGG